MRLALFSSINCNETANFRKEEQALNEEEEKCKERTKETRTNLEKYLKAERIKLICSFNLNFLIFRIIKVFLETEDDCDIDLFLSYQVTQAHWKPFYDIRVDSSGNDQQKINVSWMKRLDKMDLLPHELG